MKLIRYQAPLTDIEKGQLLADAPKICAAMRKRYPKWWEERGKAPASDTTLYAKDMRSRATVMLSLTPSPPETFPDASLKPVALAPIQDFGFKLPIRIATASER